MVSMRVTKLVRNGYANGNSVSQEYNFAYDAVGENTAVSIGSRIASVSYTNQDGTVDILPADGYTYDGMGNTVTYFNGHNNWNFIWKYGRQLASATDGTNTITVVVYGDDKI